MQQFNESPFPKAILQDLKRAGFSNPTPIQAQSWPIAMQGHDLISVAKTGSGKTLGFLLPGFMHVKKQPQYPVKGNAQPGGWRNGRGGSESWACDSSSKGGGGPLMVVLAPTRELAVQIKDEATKFGKSCGVRNICMYGGAPKYPQIRAIEVGVELVVATPGRLNDLASMRKCSLR
jgi:ATP-dependent RNA helicase DDX5/DBP2